MTGIIYCIYNDINEKVYIGKTNKTISERFREHCRDCHRRVKERRPLYSAMKKHGVERFHIVQIDTAESDDALSELEQYWINYFNSYHCGYNATRGGEGRQRYNPKELVRDYKSGTLIQDIAKKHKCSIETVATAVHKAGFSGKENRDDGFKRKVYQFDPDGNFIQEFPSQTDAALWLIQQGQKGSMNSLLINIGRVIKGIRRTAAGYVWKEA